LRTVDEARLATHSDDVTTFAIDSFVLVQYASTPPTRLHTKWEGPISSILSEYTLLNLISKKTRTIHAGCLNPLKQDPMDTARRDYMEFFVESILSHSGDTRRVSTLLFHVKWLNHPSTSNTWDSWRNLRSCEALFTYLRNNALQRLIPRTHRNDPRN
jgi:Chromo (CHRromatin Organisation MOdifier) domain